MNDKELLKKLISIQSYVDSSRNEKEIADFLVKYLKENLPWLEVETQQVEGDRYNIIAKNSDNPDYVFISHMDTVLPSSKDQLYPFEKDGRIYGLGSTYKTNLSNGGFFEAAIVANAWNCLAISYGPVGTAHTPDEYIEIQSFLNCKSKFKELLKS
ncbi:MAG: hypothetical protein ACOCXT_00220 [Candidatus Dojkabacteria bacterium]